MDNNNRKKIDTFLRMFEEYKKSLESGTNDRQPEIICEKTVIEIREKNANETQKTKVKKVMIQKRNCPVSDLNETNLDAISKDVDESLKEATAELEKLKLSLKYKNGKPKFGKGVPKIIAFAQLRAKERERMKNEIVERKRFAEEEKARQASVQGEEKKLERIAERKKMLEKKQFEIDAAAEELMKKEKMMIMKQAAINREKIDLLKRCFLAWQNKTKHAEMAKNDAAVEHYKKKLARKTIKSFFSFKLVTAKKMNRAKELHEKKSIRSVFQLWKQEYKTMKQNSQVAEDFYDACLLKKYFNIWRVIAYQYKMKTIASAIIHYESKLLHRYFDLWKTYPDRKRMALERETSKEKWREAVREIVPDFNPHVEF